MSTESSNAPSCKPIIALTICHNRARARCNRIPKELRPPRAFEDLEVGEAVVRSSPVLDCEAAEDA